MGNLGSSDDSASDSTAWLGSYNYLKAEETPQSNGAAITGGSTEGCETQKTCSTYNSANGHTCRSCKDGYAFRLQSYGHIPRKSQCHLHQDSTHEQHHMAEQSRDSSNGGNRARVSKGLQWCCCCPLPHLEAELLP